MPSRILTETNDAKIRGTVDPQRMVSSAPRNDWTNPGQIYDILASGMCFSALPTLKRKFEHKCALPIRNKLPGPHPVLGSCPESTGSTRSLRPTQSF
jgi:hypothetical protein